MDLKLGSDEDFPRRLVVFPAGQVLAFGGDDGSLSCIENTTSSSSSSNTEPVTVRTIRQYDEAAIRAVAVSADGKRIAVGFDNGSTRIYQYDEYDVNSNSPHPFVPPSKNSGNDSEDEDDDNSGGFLSQRDDDMDLEDEEGRFWAGPQLEGPIRDLQFLPHSHWLAIASEAGLCIIDVESADTMTNRYLQNQVEKEHNNSGIRAVAINENKWIASIAMNGRMCIWEASGLEQLANVTDSVPVFRDPRLCIPKNDTGERLQADPGDRSCIPLWVRPGVLALPGKVQLQLRSVSVANEAVIVNESEDKAPVDPSRSHIESIVALATNENHIVSSGRDGRVNLWQLDQDAVS